MSAAAAAGAAAADAKKDVKDAAKDGDGKDKAAGAADAKDKPEPAFDEKLTKAEAEAAHVSANTSRLILDAVKRSSNQGVVTTVKCEPAIAFQQPHAAYVDAAGNIYVTDHEAFCVRKIAAVPAGAAAGTVGVSSVVCGVPGKKYTRPRRPPVPLPSQGDTKADAKGADAKAADAKAAPAAGAAAAGTAANTTAGAAAAPAPAPVGASAGAAAAAAAAAAPTTTAAQAAPAPAAAGAGAGARAADAKGDVKADVKADAKDAKADAKGAESKLPVSKPLQELPEHLQGRPVVQDGKVIFVKEPRVKPKPAQPPAPLPYDGPVADALFHSPYACVVDSKGNLFVSDCAEHKVRKVDLAKGVVTTFCGSGEKGCKNGPALEATFSTPYGLCIDQYDNLYVCDADNERIRKVTPAGEVSTFCGTGERGAKNGKALESTFSFPVGASVDKDGTMYVADCGNHVLRKIDGASGEVSIFAGCGREGWEDGLALDARFQFPGHVVVDPYGAVLVADSAGHKIRRVAPLVSLATLKASLAAFPKEILKLVNSYCPEVVVSTLAGTNAPGKADGTGAAASFNWVYHIAIESHNEATGEVSLIISDKTNNLLRRLTYRV